MRKLFIPLAVLAVMLLSHCGGGKPEVSYAADIQPILQRHCIECHIAGGPGYEASGLGMASYQELMNGTRYGTVVLPGDNLGSVLVMLIEGRADPSINMPHGDRPPLKQAEIETVRRWVEQGARNN